VANMFDRAQAELSRSAGVGDRGTEGGALVCRSFISTDDRTIGMWIEVEIDHRRHLGFDLAGQAEHLSQKGFSLGNGSACEKTNISTLRKWCRRLREYATLQRASASGSAWTDAPSSSPATP
jgi:hypothetical protein